MNLRTPPHSIEAEQSVLGGLMIDNAAFDRIADVVGAGDFYRYEHRLIFDAAVELIRTNKPADVVTVFERLQALGSADDCGGLVYLNDLAQSVPSSANIRRYAEITRERAVLRKLIGATEEIATAAFNPGSRSADALLGAAEARIMEVSRLGERSVSTQYEPRRLMTQLIDRVSELANNPGEVTGLPTGFRDIDSKLDGLQRGDLIVLAARPSMGKTALALNMAASAAIKGGAKVVIFSMEMSASQLAARMVSSVGRIPGYSIKTGRVVDDQWGRLAEAADKIAACALRIDEAAGLTVGDLRSRTRRLARELGGVDLVVVDYLQLMSGGGSEENRATELADITRGLKALAKEMRCPVLALSQLNRSVETRGDKRPMMSDLRESGAIEQDADVILFIYRDDYYNRASKEPGVAEIIIAKHRMGATGTAKLAWLAPITRFDNLAIGYEPPKQSKTSEGDAL